MVTHSFNPSTQEAEVCEFEVSLVYRASSRKAPKLQRNPVSKNKTNKQTKNKQTNKKKTKHPHKNTEYTKNRTADQQMG